MFLETENGGLINASEIVRLYMRRSDARWVATLRGDDGSYVLRADVEIAQATAELLPAAPGFERLVAIFGVATDEAVLYLRQPIIGWRVASDFIVPVTMDDWGGDRSAVRFPDGRVYDHANDDSFENEAEWQAAMEKLNARQRGGAA